MSKYVVTTREPSALRLADWLEGKAVRVPESEQEQFKIYKENIVINFGWATQLAHINKLHIEKLSKVHTSHMMARVFGVKACNYLTREEAIGITSPDGWLIRDSRHSRGTDIVFIATGGETLPRVNNKWFVPRFMKDREYRLFVFKDKVFKIFRKHPNNPEQICWGSDLDSNRWERVNLEGRCYDEIKRTAIKAVKALGLDFGAVDMGTKGWRDKPLEHIVFEVNTAPELNDDTAERLAKEIREYFEG